MRNAPARLPSFSLFAPLALLAVTGCSGTNDDGDQIAVASDEATLAPTNRVVTSGGCDPEATAGGGWVDTTIPQSSGMFTVQFRVTPTSGANHHPIDAVIGLSNGGAKDFADLGPSVRFNSNGYIEARNGDRFSADEKLPYTFQDGPYEIRMTVYVAQHTYSVWARHLDSVNKSFSRIAAGYAFRTEQQSVGSLDSVARFVDGSVGSVTTCGLTYSEPLPWVAAVVAR